jgi:hypothetical protein
VAVIEAKLNLQAGWRDWTEDIDDWRIRQCRNSSAWVLRTHWRCHEASLAESRDLHQQLMYRRCRFDPADPARCSSFFNIESN